MGKHLTPDEKELLRMAQFNICTICGKPLGEDIVGHAPWRSHAHWTHCEGVHDECHKKTSTYGKKRPDPQDPFGY